MSDNTHYKSLSMGIINQIHIRNKNRSNTVTSGAVTITPKTNTYTYPLIIYRYFNILLFDYENTVNN